jgi:hypothetical protein
MKDEREFEPTAATECQKKEKAGYLVVDLGRLVFAIFVFDFFAVVGGFGFVIVAFFAVVVVFVVLSGVVVAACLTAFAASIMTKAVA